jgi:LCP family protein required for cell wall assembly
MADEEPDYKVYRSRPRLLRRGPEQNGLAELKAPDAPPEHDVRRGGRRLPKLRRFGRHSRLTPGRVVKWLLIALAGWIALSAALFMISAQIQRGDLADKLGAQLDPGPYPLTGANTILVLGSDARTKGTKEPGANTIGQPSRSDTIMLMRVGGGRAARLSIPRDTFADIPGHGRDKINAAYAFGGSALAIRTVEQFTGVDVNHLIEVSFDEFPGLIDAMGGITYKGGCVHSKINGGRRNGGTTLRLKRGETEIDGDQALALARTRKNLCNASEDDLTRAKRQQQLVAAMKDKVTSFETFIRLPWVSWAAPRAVRSDMAGPTLLGVAGASLTGGAGKERVLKPSGATTLPDGGAGLTVDDATKQDEVERFLRG